MCDNDKMEVEQQFKATETTLTTLSPVPFTDAETKPAVPKQEDNNPNRGSNTSVTPTITFNIPPHLMGRDVNNPIDDVIGTGRKVPKPRLGVKVPYRNLTSQIVTQDEIAQEIFERSHKKYPYLDCPEGGDVFFAKKLTHRLANRIVPTSACSSGNNNMELKCDRPSSAGFLYPKNISQLKTVSNDVNSSESMQYDASASAGNSGLEFGNLNKPQVNRVSMPERKKFQPFPLIKLLPELEKELALKQLMEFSKPRQKKDRLKAETLKKQLVKEKQLIVRRNKRSENNNNIESKTPDVNKVPKKRGRKKKSEILKQLELAKKTTSGILTNNNNNCVDSTTNDVADTTADVSQITEVLPVEGCEIMPVKDNRYLKKYSNKRLLAKRPPSPPPIEILMNGIENVNDKVNKNEEKRSIPKSRRLRKRRRVVPIKRIKLEEQKTNFPIKQNGETSTVKKMKVEQQPVDKCRSRMMREINRLLGDEGAINMIYSVEQKRTPGSEPKRIMLPSVRRKKKDLLLKTKLVKSAVLRLSTTPSQTLDKNSLRRRRTLPVTVAESRYVQAATPQRKFSSDSHDSHQSLNSPMQQELFPFPAKIIVPADASRIIRRHSSSSSYSSRSNSPRRMSIDADRTGHAVFIQEGTPEEQSAFLVESNWSSGYEGESGSHEVKVDKSDTASQSSKTPLQGRNKETDESETARNTNTGGSVLNKEITQIVKVKLKAEMSKNLIKSINGNKVLRGRRKVIYSPEMRERSARLNTCLNDAVLDFTSSESPPPPASVSPAAVNKGSTTVPSTSALHSNVQPSIDSQRGSASEETARSPAAATNKQNFKEITLHRYDHLVQIILTPVSTKMTNALNVQVLRELISAMNQLRKDDSCRTVLLTSTGNVFCQGVDFSALIQHTPDKRQSTALEMAVAVKDFVKNLATFTKPIIAGVHGAAVGLGVTMLPFFDMVFASDKATFHTPYAKLGQVPEGAATLTLPSMLGNTATSELLFTCRILTASEALHFGLVTRILWSGSFQEELISLIHGIASQSSQSMDATKALLRHRLCTNLETTLVSESHLLVQHWSSSECQENFKKYLEEELIALQKQRDSNN